MADQYFLGLDILDTYYPNYVLLKPTKTQLEVEKYGVFTDIKEELRQLKKVSSKITVSLPRDKIFGRQFSVRVADPARLEASILSWVSENAPIELENYWYGYTILTVGEQLDYNIFFAAVSHEQMASYKTILESYELTNVDFCVSSLAYFNAFAFDKLDEIDNANYLILDIGLKKVELYFIVNKSILYLKNFNFGADALSALIAEKMNIEFEFAQRIAFNSKFEISDDRQTAEVLKQSILEWSGKLLQEIQAEYKLLQTKYNGLKLTKIFLTTPDPMLDNFSAHLEEKLKVPAEVLHPFAKIRNNMKAEQLDNIAWGPGYFYQSLGLALNSRGLMIFPFKKIIKSAGLSEININKNFFLTKNFVFLIAGTIACLILLIISGFFIIKAKSANYNKKLSTLKKDMNTLQANAAEIKKLKYEIEFFEREIHPGKSVLFFMNNILADFPEDIIVDNISYKKFHAIIIKGRVINIDSLNILNNRINKDGSFKGSDIKSLGADGGYIKFRMTCYLKES